MQAPEILLYYAAVTLLTVAFFLRRRPLKGMRLRLRGAKAERPEVEGRVPTHEALVEKSPSDYLRAPQRFSQIQPSGERPLNVVFNYNGHSWDAYEVLGLPAGSSTEKVEVAYREAQSRLDKSSHGFLAAAYAAIQEQWKSYRKTGVG